MIVNKHRILPRMSSSFDISDHGIMIIVQNYLEASTEWGDCSALAYSILHYSDVIMGAMASLITSLAVI